MQNLFNSDLKINVKYDLKGSTYGRTIQKGKWCSCLCRDASIARKDQDFLNDDLKIDIPDQLLEKLHQAIRDDSNFMFQNDIIDYSFMIGIHNKGTSLT